MTVSEQERGERGKEGGRESDCAMTSRMFIFAVTPLEFWLPTLHGRKGFRKSQCKCMNTYYVMGSR